jgi:uncharacterized protein YcbX
MTEDGVSVVGRVDALYRYPVKSLLGETLPEVTVAHRGLDGDRAWAVRDADGKLGSGKSTRRFRRMDGLLALSARLDGQVPVLTFPDGATYRADEPGVHAALSSHVGRDVTLGPEEAVSHFDEGPVHLVTTASLRTLGQARGRSVDARRTRANVVLACDADGFPEHDWVGRRVRLGANVVLRVLDVMPRCVMVTMAQADLGTDATLLRDVTELTEGALGVVADVERGGSVRIGDPARLEK